MRAPGRIVFVLLLIVALGGSYDASAGPQQATLTPQRFSNVSSGVALIRTFNCKGVATASGSGFLVGTKVVMTARHVVDSSCSVKVRVDGAWIRVKRWVYWSTGSAEAKTEDVATLLLEQPSAGYLFSIRTTSLPVGTSIAMVGHPLAKQIALTQGEILLKRRVRNVPVIVLNLLGAEGASGSAIVDRNGNVLGILQQGFGGTDLLGERTSGIVLGIDLPRWWQGGARQSLCRSYPAGGIKGCVPDLPARKETKRPPTSTCAARARYLAAITQPTTRAVTSWHGWEAAGGILTGASLEPTLDASIDLWYANSVWKPCDAGANTLATRIETYIDLVNAVTRSVLALDALSSIDPARTTQEASASASVAALEIELDQIAKQVTLLAT